MAQINNVFDTYDAAADREQLSNVIYNISPTATPLDDFKRIKRRYWRKWW